MSTQQFTWVKDSTPEELHPMLELLAEEYPVAECGPTPAGWTPRCIWRGACSSKSR